VPKAGSALADDMAALSYSRRGSGEPLVLLHALGASRRAWDPVLPALAARFDVVALDLPGFGESPPLPPGEEPSAAVLARAVADLLCELGIDAPHVVGNSLGGWVALELAGIRPVASLTLLAPAGLWRRRTPLYDRVSLRTSRRLARSAPAVLSRLVGHPLGRVLVLGQSHGRPARMTAEQARAVVHDLGTCPGFDATLAATLGRHYVSRGPQGAPVTVAFGSRDLILLPWQSRHLDELPPDTRVTTLPRCGHFPMADDPGAVVAAILASNARQLTAPPRPSRG
jgi:pimeloyl-ACP methyl ester carboxylesterase